MNTDTDQLSQVIQQWHDDCHQAKAALSDENFTVLWPILKAAKKHFDQIAKLTSRPISRLLISVENEQALRAAAHDWALFEAQMAEAKKETGGKLYGKKSRRSLTYAYNQQSSAQRRGRNVQIRVGGKKNGL